MSRKEKKKSSSLLFKFGAAFLASFAGFLFARLRSKSFRSLPPPPPSHLDADNQLRCRGAIIEDVHSTTRPPISEAQDKTFLQVENDNGSSSCSSIRRSIDRDRILLPESNELLQDFEVSAVKVETRHVGRSEYEKEVESLKTMVMLLEERERSLEMQLLEYYDMKEEEEDTVMELQNQLKIKDAEAQVLALKIECLQGENMRLKAQVADHRRDAIKGTKRKLRSDDEERDQAQMFKMKLQEQEDDTHMDTVELDLIGSLQRLHDLKSEREELKRCNNELQRENSELARRLESIQNLAISMLEDHEVGELQDSDVQEHLSRSSIISLYETDYYDLESKFSFDDLLSTRRIVAKDKDDDVSNQEGFSAASRGCYEKVHSYVTPKRFKSLSVEDGLLRMNPFFDIQDVGAKCKREEFHQQEGEVQKEEPEYSHLIARSNERKSDLKEALILMGEGYEFQKEELVQLWMALRFITEEPMEIIGAAYIDKLVHEGYILNSDSNSRYKVTTKTMFSENKSKYLVLKSTVQQNVEPTEISHVSVCDGANDAILETLHKFKNLKTLLFRGTCGLTLEKLSLDCYEFLSTLDLSGTHIKELPGFVVKMSQLRYLDLSWTSIEHLPETITCLKRLQTLKLRGCSRIRRLPRDMKMLTELRHLDFNILGQLDVMPKGLGALIELRTLSSFIVCAQEGFDIKELRKLNNLSGEFCIARLENVKSDEAAMCASIGDKLFLKKLELRWSDLPLRDLKNEVSSDIVLNNLRPYSDLEELTIRCYAGTNLPSWIVDESYFQRLARITLFKCEHISVFPSIQFLPSVEYLELVSLNSLIKVDVRGEIGHVAFPKLQTLIIDEMLRVEAWTKAKEGDFPCLVELTINECPNLSTFPSLLYLTSLNRLEMSACPQVKFSSGKRFSALLEFLTVDECPSFVESCRKEGGQEWGLIKHVPNIWIDQKSVFQETESDNDIDVVGDDVDITTDDS